MIVLHLANLIHNFSGFQIPLEPKRTSKAKCAPEGATHLTGNAECAAGRVWDEYRFNEMAVTQSKQVLRCPIRCCLLLHNSQGIQLGAELQLRPEHLTQVTTIVPGLDTAVVDVSEELASSKPWLPDALNPSFQFGQRKVFDENGFHHIIQRFGFFTKY